MNDLEKEAEDIIRAASGKPNSSISWAPDEGWNKDQWEQLKDTLRAYGTITHYNDAEDTIKFTVSDQGRSFLVAGGFETMHMRRMEAEANICAADSARKSATYAKWAAFIAAAALAVSIISLSVTMCRQPANRGQAATRIEPQALSAKPRATGLDSRADRQPIQASAGMPSHLRQ